MEKPIKDIENLRTRPFCQNGITYEQWLMGIAMQAIIPYWIDAPNNMTHHLKVVEAAKEYVNSIIKSQI